MGFFVSGRLVDSGNDVFTHYPPKDMELHVHLAVSGGVDAYQRSLGFRVKTHTCITRFCDVGGIVRILWLALIQGEVTEKIQPPHLLSYR